MSDILYAPDREHVVTTNAWAFLHWLRTTRGIDLPDWAALQRWSASDQAAFRRGDRRVRPAAGGAAAAGTARRASRRRWCCVAPMGRDWRSAALLCPSPTPSRPRQEMGRGHTRRTMPADVAAPLDRLWPACRADPPFGRIAAARRPPSRRPAAGRRRGVALARRAAGRHHRHPRGRLARHLLATAAEERATVLVAPAQALAEAAFQRARRRPNLADLRTIVATGGPLSPEGRRRIYTWIKSDLMLLARTGDTFWGNPLEPVLVRPAGHPGLPHAASFNSGDTVNAASVFERISSTRHLRRDVHQAQPALAAPRTRRDR